MSVDLPFAFLLSWQDDLMKSFVTQWFQEELLSECRAERERGNMNTLETLLDYATEQFVEHSIFSCINMTTLRLTRYLTKKKTQQNQNQRCIKHNRVMGVQEDKTSYHSCNH